MGKFLFLLIFAFILFHATHANDHNNDVHAREEKRDDDVPYKYKACVMSWYTIHIKSNVNNLEFRCQSKDDDLGMVTRNAGEIYDIKFCLNVWKSTVFFCHFYWESKQRMFEVWLKLWDQFLPPFLEERSIVPSKWLKLWDQFLGTSIS
ncbi:unnamed protein product [Lactuca saligna]|uniref:S-protein homolog n=1 Tax=Lactuca saligna TaxID=75948 RepID=A0AA35ZDF4_LACSI|nr:unnamed protein product [Lactuca saligna]